MKRLMTVLLVWTCTASAAIAQGMGPDTQDIIQKFQSMTPQQQADFMASMQAQAAQMQQCIDQVGQTEIDNLTARAKTLGQQIKELCTIGKRAEAETLAQTEGQLLADTASAKQLESCSKGMVQDLYKHTGFRPKNPNAHVCD